MNIAEPQFDGSRPIVTRLEPKCVAGTVVLGYHNMERDLLTGAGGRLARDKHVPNRCSFYWVAIARRYRYGTATSACLDVNFRRK